MSRVSLWLVASGLAFNILIAMHAVSQSVTVYQCVSAGQRIFSDQPCAPDAQQREIGESNRMDAQPVISAKTDAPRPRKRMDDSSDKEKRVADCNRIREQLADIVAQERAGYTAKRGEQLRLRRVRLDDKYRLLRCERYR